mgnify:CR=1 FL=1
MVLKDPLSAESSTLAKPVCWTEDIRHIICLTNGSQTAFFMLFNLFAGVLPDGREKKICLPLAPEYIGYADLGLTDDMFVSTRPLSSVLYGVTTFWGTSTASDVFLNLHQIHCPC